MQKTQTAEWPAPRSLKEELEAAARSRHTSVADLLEQIVREWLERSSKASKAKAEAADEDDEERQKRLHAAAAPFIGSLHGGDPYRAENARLEIRKRLAEKYGR